MSDAENRYIPELPMKWYHFLINFYLWYLMFCCMISIFSFLTENMYGGITIMILDSYQIPGMDVINVIACLGNAGLLFLLLKTRSALSNNRRIGPKLLYLYYLLVTVLNVGIDIAIVVLAASKYEINYVNLICDQCLTIFINWVIYICNKVYFDNRKDYFDFN